MARFGSMDVNGLREFQKQLAQLKEPEVFVQECTKELAARLLEKVIKRTPVGQYPKGSGKVGGTLRRGWTGGKDSDGAQYAQNFDIQKKGTAYVIEIINPVEYASYVEYGHRTANHKGWVKGRFMMTISEDEIRTIAPKLLEKRIAEYLRQVMG